ncbi:MAG: AmmeMemoRadiSam system protein B [Phycisphaerales bacterium JB043]
MSDSPTGQGVPGDPGGIGQAPQPVFDVNAAHMQQPKLRPIRGFPVKQGEQVSLGIADATQVSDQVVIAPMQSQVLLRLMDGSRTLLQIMEAAQQQHNLQIELHQLQDFVARLDNAGVIVGPTARGYLQKMRDEYEASELLPPGMTGVFADALARHKAQQDEEEPTEEYLREHGGACLRTQLGEWMDQVDEVMKVTPFENMPRAIVAPHIDYMRGWVDYATVWARLRGLDAPDRVIILGTNHFGRSSGVCGCDKGFNTPMGDVPLDSAFMETLREKLGEDNGERLFKDRYDHEREHSIEVQLPWIQGVFGGDDGSCPPVFGVLVHNTTVNGGLSYNEEGLDFEPFVEAMRATLDELGGRTLIVCSADLSHVGPQFGDNVGLVGEGEEVKQAHEKVQTHDEGMLELFTQGKCDEMVGTLTWQQNKTRWCSAGALQATARLVASDSIELLDYRGSIDEDGAALVTYCAMALH